MASIRFICQRCQQPLKLTQPTETSGLDGSQEPAAWKLPAARGEPGETPEEASTSREDTDVEELPGGASGGPLPGDGEPSRFSPSSFTLLGKLSSERTLSSIQKAMGGISDILSGDDLGQPLCEDCTDSLLEQLDTQLAISASESENYRRCLETRDRVSEEEEREELQGELKDAELEEARLVQELAEVDKNRESAAVALEAAQAEAERLGRWERQHQRDCRELHWQQLELHDELRSVESRLWYAQAQLAQLVKTSAFKAAFDIRVDGPLAVINNFRLGCVPAVPVSWGEINAAWGQTALLLAALSNAVGLPFQRYRLVPCGGHSYLKSLSDDSLELPLFCAWGPRALPSSRFDQAMVAFLDCMQQFKEGAEKGEQGLRMPYRIHADRGLMEDPGVGGGLYSIRTHLNPEERWAKALKLMLTNFKWALDWVSSRYHQK
ncbi:PREDICTED: beclin-2 [Miniopterus natalensis]|uniref:beclin-2 n=1 Tax=Miniopterus natalensis TaxID=291302 RepID=UPI0007A70DE4|nr:PREDICTED: beclin-2 [Miniopterus natalensis]